MKKLILSVFAIAMAAIRSAPANAHHDLQIGWSVNPNTADTVASVSASVNAGTHIAKDATVHLDPGEQVAYADDATSPVSPPPVAGDHVADADITGDLLDDLCGNPTTYRATGTWVDPIEAGAPPNTVAQVKLTATPLPILTITKQSYVVKSNGDSYQPGPHHDLVIPDMPDEFTCSGSSSSITTTVFGFARVNGSNTDRILLKNPKTSGTKTSWVVFTDTNGATHSTSSTHTVTRR